jgi:hypothetical protein
VSCDGFRVRERCLAVSRNRRLHEHQDRSFKSKYNRDILLYVNYMESLVFNLSIPPLPLVLAAAFKALMTWLSENLTINRWSFRALTISIAALPLAASLLISSMITLSQE